MRSCPGRRAADRLRLAWLPLMLLPQICAAQGFDAIFYRARAAFNYCYSEASPARVGWSLWPLDQKISYESGTCLDPKPTALSMEQKTASEKCAGGCSADCAGFVLKAWQSGNTSELLSAVDSPDECANAFGRSDAKKIVANDKDRVSTSRALLQPGDDCENTGHVALFVQRRADGLWKTWEAHGRQPGIGPGKQQPEEMVKKASTSDPCRAGSITNGCFRPKRERTGPPTTMLPADGDTIKDPKFKFRFTAPQNFAALGDYLLWISWDNGPNDTQHRLIRIPAFTRRDAPESVRLARFSALAACPKTPGQTCPVDIAEARTIELGADVLTHALAVVPKRFKPEKGGSVSDTAGPTLVPCVETSAPTYPGQKDCVTVQPKDPLSFVAGRTYTWRVRVERYGEERSGRFARAQAIGPCRLTKNGFEAEDACLDPEWSAPQKFTMGGGATAVARDDDDACAARDDGTVVCWGDNTNGQLGDGTTTTRFVPAPVPMLGGVTRLSAYAFSTCATGGGNAWCWGNNARGQLGDGTIMNRASPVAVQLTNVDQIAVGGSQVGAVTKNGTPYEWGLYYDCAGMYRSTPVKTAAVAAFPGASAIATGTMHYCAMGKDGQAWCWGSNASGQLGFEDPQMPGKPLCKANTFGCPTCTYIYVTNPVPGLAGVSSVATGYAHSCAVAGGAVYCWGDNSKGELGDGTLATRPSPVKVIANGAAAVTAHGYETCALLSDGSVRCWGFNGGGQVGDGTTIDRSSPVPVTGLSGAVQLSTSSAGSCALDGKGIVWCWGYNTHGVLGRDPATLMQSTTPIVVYPPSGP